MTLCKVIQLSNTTEAIFHFSLSCIGEGNGNPLQCSCLENPRDGGAWWAAVYGVAQSQTWLKRLSSSSTGEGNGNPLQCSCLENPRDRGAWWASVYGVAKSWTRLKQLSSSSSSIHTYIYVYDSFTQIQGKIRKSLNCMMIECAGKRRLIHFQIVLFWSL